MSKCGTALKAALSWAFLEADEDCPCEEHAREMDEKGCEWCKANVDLIASWLEDEYHRRELAYPPLPSRSWLRRFLLVVFWQAERRSHANP